MLLICGRLAGGLPKNASRTAGVAEPAWALGAEDGLTAGEDPVAGLVAPADVAAGGVATGGVATGGVAAGGVAAGGEAGWVPAAGGMTAAPVTCCFTLAPGKEYSGSWPGA
jgi:hypothetical protein